IPVTRLQEAETARLLRMEDELHQTVVGHPSGSWMSNLRAPLLVISATSLSSSRSYMDMVEPEGSLAEGSVRYKRPEFAPESRRLTGLGYTSVKPVLAGGKSS
ncbi:MAG TPA: hypothetical protein VNA15_11645, partial [Candidatus Angelobacter sp.]|nr:hypothetical protein [Candidatus Angelobacter sp.]